jgi:hypothetical protein
MRKKSLRNRVILRKKVSVSPVFLPFELKWKCTSGNAGGDARKLQLEMHERCRIRCTILLWERKWKCRTRCGNARGNAESPSGNARIRERIGALPPECGCSTTLHTLWGRITTGNAD